MPNQPPGRDDSSFIQQVQAMIRVQEASSLAGSVGRLLLGLGACFLMGFIAATLATSCLFTVFGRSYIGWSGWFALYVIVLVPFLIWHERRSRQEYLTDAMRSLDSNPSSRGEYEMDQAGLQVALYASWLTFGPRALIDGVRGMRGLRTSAQHAVLDRAATLVVSLFKSGAGVEIKQLVHAED
ncbi:MAG TPA: hypothetical protein VFC46_00395, partial [Humisphaera sp.]|nr:hypothetical protein [Humisphaera sp.]